MPFTRIEGEQPTAPGQVLVRSIALIMHFQWGDLCARRSVLRAAQRKNKRKRLRVLFENGGDERVAVGRIREVADRACTATRVQMTTVTTHNPLHAVCQSLMYDSS